MQECQQSRSAADILSRGPAFAAAASRSSAAASCIRAEAHGRSSPPAGITLPRGVREGLSACLFMSGHAAELKV